MENKHKIQYFHIIALIFAVLSGLVFRLYDNSYPMWWDELYALTMAGNPKFPFYSVFLDVGNPPLFYILSKVWISIIKVSTAGYENIIRLLPCLFSVFSIPFIYFLVKENDENKYLPVVSALLFSINYYSVYTGKEYRAYSLLIFLIIVLTVFLFRIYKNNFNKDFIIYALIASMVANCHLYGVFILICNFILMMFVLKKDRLKFFFSNLFALITFLPWFLISVFISKTADFVPAMNSFIIQFFKIPSELFFSRIALVVVIIAFFINKKKFNLYSYSFFIIFSMLIFCGLISIIKPVIRDWYFVSLVPFSVIIVSKTLFLFKNKYAKIIISFLLLVSYFSFQDCIDRKSARELNIDLLCKTAQKEKNTPVAMIGYNYFALFYNLNNDIIELPTQADNDEIYEIIKNDNHKTLLLKTDENNISYWNSKFKIETMAKNKNEIIIKIFK